MKKRKKAKLWQHSQKKNTSAKITKIKPKTAVKKVAEKPKQRILGHAKGIFQTDDCWEDDFND
jgi:NADH:ubiquinone oxidoreductase subunit